MLFRSWLRDERLRMARELLAATDIPIVEIAESLGYTTSQNFATAFKEKFDCTPSKFREGMLQAASHTSAID